MLTENPPDRRKSNQSSQAIMKMTTYLVTGGALMVLACASSCERESRGLRLPEGDIERGKAAFVEMKCHHCHSVAGVELPKTDAPAAISHELGGVVRRVKSYGELVTAIIRPQHIVSPEYLAKLPAAERADVVSPMPDFNERLTVRQLTDIVTFLHARYQKAPPPGVNYPYYMP
jgi:mono/diheme cytochrome c family protein